MEVNFNSKAILIDIDVKNQYEAFEKIAKIANKLNYINDEKLLIDGFLAREHESTTGFEDGIAIPHARISAIKKAAIIFARFKAPIEWNSLDGDKTQVAVALLIPENESDKGYLDVLANLSRKLLDKSFRDFLKKEQDPQKLIDAMKEEKTEIFSNVSMNSNAIKIVAVSACATGVAHTYMARDSLINAGNELNWEVNVETQGQKGQEFKLTQKQIDEANVVILAADIVIEKDRFVGKKIYQLGTKQVMADPKGALQKALAKGQILASLDGDVNAFDVKSGSNIVKHIMSGVSYMIPFIVFAGITFAVVTGLGKLIFNEKQLDYSGSFSWKTMDYIQAISSGAGDPITLHGFGIGFMWTLNKFAGIGFTVMMPIMGAYIAYSVAGRSAIAPAFICTFMANDPTMWMTWGPFAHFGPDDQNLMKGLSIFGALLFGFSAGYLVKWINTKWKINKYIQPIMPIIIIPLFVTLFLGLVYMLLLGNIFGIAIGYLYYGINWIENSKIGMAAVGLLLGLIAGIDMGGPINKIASFSATALIYEDAGHAMGAAAAAFAIAPLGAGIATLVFKNKFEQDKPLGINAVILGFMGISEGAIPFAIKYTWAAIVPNIICSGIAGMCAGLFDVSGWVGAWGGPIIAIFGGVSSGGWDINYIGILWYLIAIAIGTACHVVLFRIFVEIRDNRGKKITKDQFKAMFKRNTTKIAKA
ncbi:fructose PTS transporter subunit IIA [Spiroplasma endosymbiont of Labia minor]|uniref:PTS fructose transporter subunit IIABC n=1 Tax=Spiroplasma endosymbiont of Labia minor TaxID=3066305 RepID=UPI0030D5E75D